MVRFERYVAPRTVAEAAKVLADGPALPFAGGTDLLPRLAKNEGKKWPPVLLNLNRIEALRGIVVEGKNLRIRALTTIAEIRESPLLREAAPLCVEAADRFASGQVRNVATVAGNLANGSPCADMSLPLLIYDAEVELARWEKGGVSFRRLPLAEFFRGPGVTAREPTEILTAVIFARPPQAWRVGFAKFGTRPSLDIAVVSVAVAAVPRNGRLGEVRIALGAVAPTPIRARTAEEAEAPEEAARRAAEEARPIDDVRATAAFRRHLVAVLTRRLLSHVAGS